MVSEHASPVGKGSCRGVACYALRRKAQRGVRGDYLVFRRGVACYARNSAQRAAHGVSVGAQHATPEPRHNVPPVRDGVVMGLVFCKKAMAVSSVGA